MEELQRFIHGVAQHLHLKLSAVVTFKILARQRISCGCSVCCICCRTSNYLRALASNGVALSKSFPNGSYETSGMVCAGWQKDGEGEVGDRTAGFEPITVTSSMLPKYEKHILRNFSGNTNF